MGATAAGTFMERELVYESNRIISAEKEQYLCNATYFDVIKCTRRDIMDHSVLSESYGIEYNGHDKLDWDILLSLDNEAKTLDEAIKKADQLAADYTVGDKRYRLIDGTRETIKTPHEDCSLIGYHYEKGKFVVEFLNKKPEYKLPQTDTGVYKPSADNSRIEYRILTEEEVEEIEVAKILKRMQKMPRTSQEELDRLSYMDEEIIAAIEKGGAYDHLKPGFFENLRKSGKLLRKSKKK